jgi:flagellar biosynthesis/type III secretory pathway M-ring protein FliF/YscJ
VHENKHPKSPTKISYYSQKSTLILPQPTTHRSPLTTHHQMSDLAWIALIIVVYVIIIKPIMQGIAQGNAKQNTQQQQRQNTAGRPQQKPPKGDDYVDYEEIK